MVIRKHKYADGGKIVSDHEEKKAPPKRYPPPSGRPGFTGAVKDAVEAVADYVAPKSIKHRKARIDDEITKAGG